MVRSPGLRRVLLAVAAAALAAQPLNASAGTVPDRTFTLDEGERPARVTRFERSAPAGGPEALAFFAAPDGFESPSDDTWNGPGVRDLTDEMGSLERPGVAYAESHTFDEADPGGEGDQDWVKFVVDESNLGLSVFVEAVSKNPGVFPIVEIYGPDTADPTSPNGLSPLSEIPEIDPNASVGFGIGDSWFDRNGAAARAFLWSDTPAGTYYVRVRPRFGVANPPLGFSEGGAGGYQLRIKYGTARRLAGSDRFLTSVKASQEMFANNALAGGACVVANGMNFPDALAGATLCGAVRGPLLLTWPDSLEGAVRSEIARLGVSRVFVLGSSKALNGTVFTAIDDIPGVQAIRIQGSDRYGTAKAIASRANAEAVLKPTTAFVVSGANFPDALSASPMAAWNGAPILLTRPDRLSPEVSSAITELGITDVVIVGGTPAVSRAVSDALVTKLGDPSHVRRVSGPNRYATSAAFARWATESDGGARDLKVGTAADPDALSAVWAWESGTASGLKFPDALSGGAMSGLAGCPLLLIDDSDAAWDSYFSFIDSTGAPQDKAYVFGGTSAVSEESMAIVEILTLPLLWELTY